MTDWFPDLSRSASPRYMAIADLIALDLREGRLSAGDRLPPQRALAKRLNVDFTTVARGYAEAQKRGLVASHVGRGTFVIAPLAEKRQAPLPTGEPDARRTDIVDFSMNLPPEPDQPDLLARMRQGMVATASNLVPLLRYQGFGGDGPDKDAAALWLGRRGLATTDDRIFVTPGTHPALMAILGILCRPGEWVLCEAITYPGLRSIAAQLRITPHGLPMDDEGILPDALAVACERLKPKALYLNPTLQNPTTVTIPEKRRRDICAVAERYRLPIIEDDAYGFIPVDGPAPLAAIAPDLTWYLGGLSKCIGAGLRLAYVLAPDARAAWPFAGALRAGNVMASPLTTAIATQWIEDGTADAILDFVRTETAARQAIVAGILPAGSYTADPLAFNIWLPLANGWSRSTFAGHMRGLGLGIVASDAFAVAPPAPEAVRLCLGGPIGRAKLRDAIDFIAHALETPPERTAAFF